MKKNIKKICNLKTLLVISGIVAIGITSIRYSNADDDWTEWTEDKMADAWTVYEVTDWKEMGGLNFGDNGSVSSANVDKEYRRKYEPLIKKVLQDKNTPNGMYDSSCYTEIMLAIFSAIDKTGYTSNPYYAKIEKINNVQWYNWSKEETRQYNPHAVPEFDENGELVTKEITEQEQKESILYIYKRLISMESRYFRKYEQISIYSSDSKLGAVVQSMIYGEDYFKKNEEYTVESAKNFYKSNKDKINCDVEMNDFASAFLNKYDATLSLEHEIID